MHILCMLPYTNTKVLKCVMSLFKACECDLVPHLGELDKQLCCYMILNQVSLLLMKEVPKMSLLMNQSKLTVCYSLVVVKYRLHIYFDIF